MTKQHEQTQAPIRQAMGDDWPLLGEIIRRHYDLTPNSENRFELEGVMDVIVSPIGRLFVSVSRLFDALVPFPGREIPIRVCNWSQADSRQMFWHRTFRYPGRKPVIFRSRMAYAGGRDIVEYVKFGLGIRMRLSAEGETLRYDSRGYLWDLGIFKLPIPDWLLLGRAVIREIPESDKRLRVEFTVDHPLWGRTFGYAGRFTYLPAGETARKEATDR